MNIYSLLCFYTPIIVYVMFNIKRIRKIEGRKNVIIHFLWAFVFTFYCYEAVQDAAGIGTLWDYVYYGELIVKTNFYPFASWGAVTHYLNIIMFLPMGFLLPNIWKECRRLYITVLIGFGMSLLIELCQLFCYRVTDIDDLIMNTTGTILGFFVWKIIKLFAKRMGKNSLTIFKGEPIIYILLGIAGIFFGYNRML